jgi:hypothetical protein
MLGGPAGSGPEREARGVVQEEGNLISVTSNQYRNQDM